jgi:hypothetical protein
MKKILFDGREVPYLITESLPMLIHGTEGSGASLYTVCLAANWFSQDYRILFLCGYPMAEEEFAQQIGNSYKNVIFYTQEKVEEFKLILKHDLLDNTIIIVKNIELFGNDIFDAIKGIESLIVSGDVTKSDLKVKLLNKEYATKVFFSDIEEYDFPELEKYQGMFLSERYKGITQIQ